ncbi:MAG TPA: divalent metal cation transporter [Candidatus Acidoferrales bacterium]|nr:divalent metal cation transporter [Candidatus Acidoferrales bacterium]
MNFKVGDWVRNFGPAWIVMIADIDIASIITSLQCGASFGYRMAFILLLLIFPLFIVQDAAGRLGTCAGLGLGEATRQQFGTRKAIIAAIPMGISDFLEYVAEYAGMAIGMYLLGFPVLLGLTLIFLMHIAVVVGRQYRRAEMVLIPLSFMLVAVIVASAFIFPINLKEFVSIGLSPLQPYSKPSFDYLLAASVGAVIMPWMLYYHSGADSRRKKKPKDLKNERIETLLGAIVSEVLMVILIFPGIRISSGSSVISALALSKVLSFFGSYAMPIMGALFLFAGFLALIVISLGSAWGVLEATGKTSRTSFMTVFMLESLPAIILVATITGYIQLMLNLMVIYPIVIIPSLYFLGKLVADKKIMNGYQYSKYEITAFTIASIMIVAGGILGLSALL